VTQEALANVAKHAGASRVGVTLSYLDDLVTLDVRDDGVGFAPPGHREHSERSGRSNGQRQTEGYGLTAMRQRVERLAGQLDIETEAGGGTAISARIPAGVLEIADG
jgi:signal transduction histidine kinase